MSDDTVPSVDVILEMINQADGQRINPGQLVEQLHKKHSMNDLIEALQRALEEGRIAFDKDGNVMDTRVLARAA